MTTKECSDGFKKTIDQFYAFPNKAYNEQRQLHFIGGVLQAALHILPNDEYFKVKQYVYDNYGYDPGGCVTMQINMEEYLAGRDWE